MFILVGSFAVIVGVALILFHRRISDHYRKYALKNDYFATRFFGARNLIPVGVALVVMGLAFLAAAFKAYQQDNVPF